MLYGYARVFDVNTDVPAARAELEALDVHPRRITLEAVTTLANAPQPALTSLLRKLRAGDTLVLHSLVRLTDSMERAALVFKELNARSINILTADQTFEAGSPATILQLQMFDMLIKYEQDASRVVRDFGKPREEPAPARVRLTAAQRAQAIKMITKGNFSYETVATRFGVSTRTIQRLITAQEPSTSARVTRGRKPALSPIQTRRAIQLYENGGMTQAEVAQRFNISESTFKRILADHKKS